MRFIERPPNPAQMERQFARHDASLRRISGEVNDAKTKEAQRRQQQVMRSAGLGNLGRAVKVETGRSTDRKGEPNAYGVIYADNGDDSRAGQALQAYSRGTTILPIRGAWLWYQTDKLARTSKVPGDDRRGRLTPERYRRMGSPLGPLQFARINANFAKLYVEVADISIRTGRATRPGKRRSRTKVRQTRVTIFFGIRNTRRAQRYDPQRIVAQTHAEIPPEIAAKMQADFASRG